MMANIVCWVIGGAIVGWLTGRTIGGEPWPGSLRDLVVGAGGAVMTGWFVPSLVGIAALHSDDFSAPALAASLLGAMLLLAIAGVMRRLIRQTVLSLRKSRERL